MTGTELVVCPCFYYEPDPDAPEDEADTCMCGHREDEHDDDGECDAMDLELL